MKKIVFILAITLSGIVNAQDKDNMITEIEIIRDSLNSSKILKIKPNEFYLKNLSHIYFPSNEDLKTDYLNIEIFQKVLEKRYNYNLSFLEEVTTNGHRDFYFEVGKSNGDQALVVVVRLSVIEQLYQENILDITLENYYKWYQIYINYYENM